MAGRAGPSRQLASADASPITAGSGGGFRALELLRLSAHCVENEPVRSRLPLPGQASQGNRLRPRLIIAVLENAGGVFDSLVRPPPDSPPG